MRNALSGFLLFFAQHARADDAPPPLPPVHDPMLAPPPAAPRVLRSWAEAIAEVHARTPEYAQSMDDVRRAEARWRVALAAVLPNAEGVGTYTHQFLTGRVSFSSFSFTLPIPNQWIGTVAVGWNVFDARAWYRVETASEDIDASELDFSERKRQIAQSLVGSMLATLGAQRLSEIARTGLEAALEREYLTQTKADAGQGTLLDVERAKQDVAAARVQLIQADESLARSRETLGLALGTHVPTSAPGSIDLATFERDVASSCKLEPSIEDRTDVAAARAHAVVAERFVTDVWLQFLPTLGVASTAAWTAPTFAFSGPEQTWNVQAVLTVPIWDGGARYGFLPDARAAADQARQALVRTRIEALVDLSRSARQVTLTRSLLTVAREQRDLAASVDRRTRESFRSGLATSLDLVISGQALRQNDINTAVLEFQASQARALAVLANARCDY